MTKVAGKARVDQVNQILLEVVLVEKELDTIVNFYKSKGNAFRF